MILVCAGLHGIMSYAVAPRINEIGIRMALGARRGNIPGIVLREVLLMVGIGVALGIAGSLATARPAEATVSGLWRR